MPQRVRNGRPGPHRGQKSDALRAHVPSQRFAPGDGVAVAKPPRMWNGESSPRGAAGRLFIPPPPKETPIPPPPAPQPEAEPEVEDAESEAEDAKAKAEALEPKRMPKVKVKATTAKKMPRGPPHKKMPVVPKKPIAVPKKMPKVPKQLPKVPKQKHPAMAKGANVKDIWARIGSSSGGDQNIVTPTSHHFVNVAMF